jgi:hypothetical protein
MKPVTSYYGAHEDRKEFVRTPDVPPVDDESFLVNTVTPERFTKLNVSEWRPQGDAGKE